MKKPFFHPTIQFDTKPDLPEDHEEASRMINDLTGNLERPILADDHRVASSPALAGTGTSSGHSMGESVAFLGLKFIAA